MKFSPGEAAYICIVIATVLWFIAAGAQHPNYTKYVWGFGVGWLGLFFFGLALILS